MSERRVPQETAARDMELVTTRALAPTGAERGHRIKQIPARGLEKTGGYGSSRAWVRAAGVSKSREAPEARSSSGVR